MSWYSSVESPGVVVEYTVLELLVTALSTLPRRLGAEAGATAERVPRAIVIATRAVKVRLVHITTPAKRVASDYTWPGIGC
jgi:hypothetical protein